MLKQVYGDRFSSRTLCYELFQRFEDGQKSTDSDREIGRTNYRFTVQEIIDDFNNSITSCHHILTNKLGMNRFATKIVQNTQTKYQKDIRILICQKVLDPVNSKAAFIKRFITCDDTVCMSSILKEMPNLYNGLEKVAQGGKNEANQIKSQKLYCLSF